MTVLVVMVVGAATGLAVIYSGLVDIAATTPHYAVTKWVLETTMDHSVERRADRISPPPAYHPGARTMQQYRQICELCHGGPGKQPSEVGKGLRPEPPSLVKAAPELRDTEIFWVVKHGIRMTGMPAFGPTHPDAELWEVVALVKSLPAISPREYDSAGRKH